MLSEERLRETINTRYMAGHEIVDAATELIAARAELKLWKPMTPDEADQALEEIEEFDCEPMSKDEIDRIMEKVFDPAYRPTEPEHVQMLAHIRRQANQLESLRAELGRLRGLLTDNADNWTSIQSALTNIASGHGDRGEFLTGWASTHIKRIDAALTPPPKEQQ